MEAGESEADLLFDCEPAARRQEFYVWRPEWVAIGQSDYAMVETALIVRAFDPSDGEMPLKGL